jgi:molecular chaperone HtpG
MDEKENPVTITQSEFIRRMKDMSEIGGGMGFYGDMPDSYNLVVNSNHPLVIKIATDIEKAAGKDLAKIREKMEPVRDSKEKLEKANSSKKEDEISQEDRDRLRELNEKLEDIEKKREARLKKFAGNNKLVKQLIDLALLSNNMLKGEDLSTFVKRSIDLM